MDPSAKQSALMLYWWLQIAAKQEAVEVFAEGARTININNKTATSGNNDVYTSSTHRDSNFHEFDSVKPSQQ